MKTKYLGEVRLIVDKDGPQASFYRWPVQPPGRYEVKHYRARSIESAAAKAHFIKRVHALQLALCKAA